VEDGVAIHRAAGLPVLQSGHHLVSRRAVLHEQQTRPDDARLLHALGEAGGDHRPLAVGLTGLQAGDGSE